MNSLQYCYQKAAPPGSTFYYSLRKLNPAARNVVVAINAFYKELEDVIFTYTDVSIAQAKFNWWRDEVIKIADGKPDHPVSLILQQYMAKFNLSPFKLIEMIDGVEQNLSPLVFPTFEDVVIYFMRTAGVRECLIANASQFYEQEIIYQSMLVIELFNTMQNLHRYTQRGLNYFPEDELKKFPDIKQLLQYQVEKIELAYKKTREQLTSESRTGLSSLLIRCDIARATCKEIQLSGFPVMEQFIDLTPVRKWWISRFNTFLI